MKTRSALLGGSLLLYAVGSMSQGAGLSGLWAPSVCVSPAVFGAALILPPETIVDAARQRLNGPPGYEEEGSKHDT